MEPWRQLMAGSSRLFREFRGLPRDHTPRIVPLDVDIDEPDRKLIVAAAGLHMNDPVTRDYGGVAILTDLHVFLAQGTVPTATGRSIGNELGFGFYPAA